MDTTGHYAGRPDAAPKTGRTRRHAVSPRLVLLWALLLSVAAALLTVFLATAQPWLGIGLVADPERSAVILADIDLAGPAAQSGAAPNLRLDRIEVGGELAPGEGPAMDLLASDLVEEPDSLDTYDEVAAFMERQSRLFAIAQQPAVRLHLVDGITGEPGVAEVYPVARPFWSLPAIFWVQVLSGLAGFVVGAWIWSLRRSDLASQMFALSGLGLMLSALPAAVYSTRELAIESGLFLLLSALNHAGAHMFGGALIALFLVYPRRLVRPRWLLVIPVLLGAWLWADVAWLMPNPTVGMYAPVLLEMLAIVTLVVIQLRAVRHSPVERAALRWLGLSVVVGAGLFVAGVAMPLMLGAEPAVSQGISFAFFVIVYAGIALGIRRYRLFDLGDWSFRILYYVAGAVLLLALDTVLIWLLNVERAPALGVSLLIVAFLYLPLRDALYRRVASRRGMEEHEVFAAAMDVAFGPTPTQRAERWRALLARLYDPLEITAAGESPQGVETDAEGIALSLPAVADSPALLLRYPRAGKDLFTRADISLATELIALVDRAATSRDAHERGAREERQRIAQDLHDDVGGRLLTGMHTADAITRPVLQDALSDIRAIVSGLNGVHAPLDRVLADARHEAARRLEASGVGLVWPVADEAMGGIVLDYRQAKALVSSVRETVTNIIRHAEARTVCVSLEMDADTLVLAIADDGRGPLTQASEGYGLRNIRQRVEAVGGRFSIAPASPGTTIAISLPLGFSAP